MNVDKAPIALEVLNNENELNDCGEIKLFYGDYVNTSIDVKVHAFMSDKPHDKSTGKYLGVIYNGKIEPGYTKKTIHLYDKINGKCKIKRGHYIKYAIQCDILDQKFDPYSNNAWSLVEGYHIYNCLPSPATPFLCEDKTTMLKDKMANIAWNKSIDDDNDPVNCLLYIAATATPHINT